MVSQLDNVGKMLRTMVDDLANQLGSAIIMLATTADDKVLWLLGVTKDLTDRVKAGELISNVAQQVGEGRWSPGYGDSRGTDINALPARVKQRRSLGGLEAVNINKYFFNAIILC
ncbi:DHHA1 domain-containing protein [Serratia ureilytica]